MRSLYTALLYLLTPLLLLYLLFRGLKEPGYRKRWGERFGFFAAPGSGETLWVHAVSMGEVNAAAGLIRSLANAYDTKKLCITTFTPTGSARVRELFGDTAFHVYSPLDLPGAARRFLDRTKPCIAIMMETEIWPNLYRQVKGRGVPLLIANARISDRSLGRYRRFSKLTTDALGCVSRIAAQSERDAGRLVEIGAPPDRVVLTGNLKFDIEIPKGLEQEAPKLRETWGPKRPVLVAGSTHPEEEPVILESFGRLLQDIPDALLVLVPRHPDRFRRAAQAAKAAGLTVARRSAPEEKPAGAQCYLVDRMGELMNFYAAGDVAFVGGSLQPVGGHNVLEPAALGKPVIVGPYTSNFTDVTDQLLDAGAAVRVTDAAGLRQTVRELFADEKARREMGRKGRERVKRSQGAVNRTLDIIAELLTEAAG